MLNPKIRLKHYKIYLSSSNVSGVQVEPKHTLSKGIHGSSVMKYARRYNKISTGLSSKFPRPCRACVSDMD